MGTRKAGHHFCFWFLFVTVDESTISFTHATRIHANRHESRPLKASAWLCLSQSRRTVANALAVGSGGRWRGEIEGICPKNPAAGHDIEPKREGVAGRRAHQANPTPKPCLQKKKRKNHGNAKLPYFPPPPGNSRTRPSRIERTADATAGETSARSASGT